MASKKYIIISLLLCLTIIIQSGFSWKYENPRIIYFLILAPLIVFYLTKGKISFKNIEIYSLISIIIIFLSTSIGWLLSQYQYDATNELIFCWIVSVSFFIGLLFSKNSNSSLALIISFILIMSISSIYGILQYFGWLPIEHSAYPPPIIGLAGSTIDFIFLIIPSIIFLFYFISLNKKYHKFLIPILIIQIIAAFLSSSRSLILLLPIFLITYTLLYIRFFRNNISKHLFLILFFSIIGLVIFPLFIWSDTFIHKISNLSHFKDGDTYSRIEFWKIALKMFRDSNFLGAGPGFFSANQSLYWPDYVRTLMVKSKYVENVHNDLLQTLCSLGLPAFLAQLFLWGGALYLQIIKFLKEKSLIALTIILSLIALYFHSLTNGASRHYPAGIFFWILIGYSWGTNKNYKKIRIKKSYFIFPIMFHFLILLFSIQITLGDYYYFKSLHVKDTEVNIILPNLEKSLNLCPYHPVSTFRLGFLFAKNGKCKEAFQLMDRYEKIGGYIKPTYFVRSYCFFLNHDYNNAILYANKEIKKWPRFKTPLLVKANSYAKLGECDEVKKIEYLLKRNMEINKKNQTNTELSYLRKKLAGPYIKNYKKNKKSKEANSEYDIIKSIICD